MEEGKAIIYSRVGCHLCQEAEALLRTYGWHVELVDIDANPELKNRYDHCVPVVVIDGRERFRGRVSPTLLRRLAIARKLRKWWPTAI